MSKTTTDPRMVDGIYYDSISGRTYLIESMEMRRGLLFYGLLFTDGTRSLRSWTWNPRHEMVVELPGEEEA